MFYDMRKIQDASKVRWAKSKVPNLHFVELSMDTTFNILRLSVSYNGHGTQPLVVVCNPRYAS